MHLILCLLFIITITRNGSSTQISKTHRGNSLGLATYFPHDNLARIRHVREVQDFQNDPLTNMSDEDLIQDLDEEKKSHERLVPIENHKDSGKFLEKRSLRKKKHHRERNQKLTKAKHPKGRRKSLKRRSRRRKGRNEMGNFPSKQRLKIQSQNHHYPKRISKPTKQKIKRFSPYNEVIDYLKSDQRSKVSGNCGNLQNCQNPVHHQNKHYKEKKRQRTKIQRKRSPDNLRRGKSIYSQRVCEAECQNQNYNSEPCICTNEKPIDFERQLKILNKGGEEVETKKEKPGILNGIQNFLKDSLKHESITTLNPFQCQNQKTTTDEPIVIINNDNIVIKNDTNFLNNINSGSTSENIFETASETITGVTRDNNIETIPEATSKIFTETTSESFTEATSEYIIEDSSEAITEATSKFFTEITSEIFTEATSETFTEATSEVFTEATSKIFPEATSETFNEATSDRIVETSSLPSSESTREIDSEISETTRLISSNRIFDCEDDLGIFDITEDINSYGQTETSTLAGTEKEIVDATFSNELDNNPCSFTNPVEYDSNESCNDNVESDDNSSDDKKSKKPIATFSLEFKTNPKAKRKGFRFRMKY